MSLSVANRGGAAAFRDRLAQLPSVLERAAQRGAQRFSDLARAAFDAQQSVNGSAWDGKGSLVRTGRLRAQALAYKAIGTRIVASVNAVPYARYFLKRGILPQTTPQAWLDELDAIVRDEISNALSVRSG